MLVLTIWTHGKTLFLWMLANMGLTTIVFSESQLGKAFEHRLWNHPIPEKIPGCYLVKGPYFLVGDEIFPLKDWRMRPYPGNGLCAHIQGMAYAPISREFR